MESTAAAPAKARFKAVSVASAIAALASPDEKAPHATLAVDGGKATDRDLAFVITKDSFLSLLTSSSSGKTLGVTCDISGQFDYMVPEGDEAFPPELRGKTVTLDVRNNGFRTTVTIQN